MNNEHIATSYGAIFSLNTIKFCGKNASKKWFCAMAVLERRKRQLPFTKKSLQLPSPLAQSH
jgi:hypothetical protein